MSTAQVLRVPVGISASARVQVKTVVDTFGHTVVDLGTDGTTVVRANSRVDVVAPTVTVPTATFTEARGAELAGALTVGGHSELTTVAAEAVTALTVTTPLLTVADPATQAIEVVARTVAVRGDLVVDGTLGTPDAAAGLEVRNVALVLGAGDDTSDVTRDSAGIVIPGVPTHMPVGRDAASYEHSIRWKRNEGDFAADTGPMAPHQRPRWTFSGGCVSIAGSDASEWFIAPHSDGATGQASLGIYYQAGGAEAVLIQRFVSLEP